MIFSPYFLILLINQILRIESWTCQNGGTPISDAEQMCSCPCGYLGDYCEYFYNNTLVESLDSLNQDCYLTYDKANLNCVCKQGFIRDTDYSCKENKCSNINCEGIGRCQILLTGEPKCTCGSIENNSKTPCNISICNLNSELLSPPFCSENSICNDLSYGNFNCKCSNDLYSGDYCDKVTNLCEQNTCSNGGTCIKMSTEKSCCLCPSGYSGSACDSRQVCGVNPCKNGGLCKAYEGDYNYNYNCECGSLYSGKNCEYLEDDCLVENSKCVNNSTCINYLGVGNYGCECKQMYSGKNCEVRMSPCRSYPCLNKGVCVASNDSFSFKCKCQNGFYGKFCENEIELCQVSSCLNGAYCETGLKLPNFNGNLSIKSKAYEHYFKCFCTSYFYGNYCEIVKFDLKIVVTISKTFGIASTISLTLLFVTVILLDLTRPYCKKRKLKRTRQMNLIDQKHFSYIPK